MVAGQYTNLGDVVGNPVEEDGTDIPGLPDQTDDDSREVVPSPGLAAEPLGILLQPDPSGPRSLYATATLADGRVIKPSKVWEDPETDVAVMRIEAPDLVAAELGDSDALEIGDFVLAMGSPLLINVPGC